jgi:hypothetical protein
MQRNRKLNYSLFFHKIATIHQPRGWMIQMSSFLDAKFGNGNIKKMNKNSNKMASLSWFEEDHRSVSRMPSKNWPFFLPSIHPHIFKETTFLNDGFYCSSFYSIWPKSTWKKWKFGLCCQMLLLYIWPTKMPTLFESAYIFQNAEYRFKKQIKRPTNGCILSFNVHLTRICI